MVTQRLWQGDDQGLFKEHERDAKEQEGLPRSMREIPRRVKDAQRMADGCCIVYPYYDFKRVTLNHDTLPQMYGNLRRAMDGQGSNSRMRYDHPDSLYGCCTDHVTIFSHA